MPLDLLLQLKCEKNIVALIKIDYRANLLKHLNISQNN